MLRQAPPASGHGVPPAGAPGGVPHPTAPRGGASRSGAGLDVLPPHESLAIASAKAVWRRLRLMAWGGVALLALLGALLGAAALAAALPPLLLLALALAYAACGSCYGLLLRHLHTQEQHFVQFQRTCALLQERHAQREGLSGYIVNSLEEIRHSIATELHDNTGQQLTVLRLALERDHMAAANGSMSRADMCATLSEAARTVQRIQRDIRHTAQGLYPPALTLVGLGCSIEHLCQDFNGLGLKIHCSVCALPPLPEAQALAVYRIAQEALSNAARYSQADEVRVSLSLSATTSERSLALSTAGERILTLAVEDNGVGFDPNITRAPGRGLGLRLMRERVAPYGGELNITSAPQKGTRVVARIPLEARQ